MLELPELLVVGAVVLFLLSRKEGLLSSGWLRRKAGDKFTESVEAPSWLRRKAGDRFSMFGSVENASLSKDIKPFLKRDNFQGTERASLTKEVSRRERMNSVSAALNPMELLPPNMTGDTAQQEENARLKPWVKNFTPLNEGFLKGKNLMALTVPEYNRVRNAPRKNMNVDLRGAPPVDIYPELGGWLQKPTIVDQSADMSSAAINWRQSRGQTYGALENRRMQLEQPANGLQM